MRLDEMRKIGDECSRLIRGNEGAKGLEGHSGQGDDCEMQDN